MHFNFFADIDLAKSGESLLAATGFLALGTMFEGVDLQHMHIPPIVLELAKLCAYLGAGMSFFRFIVGLFIKRKEK
jgi:hypothetical protein